jgi:NAD(P)-dependent dehydrogenase (short-subunit alcohol dehydrogenase family)
MRGMSDLAGKIILITGAAGAVGGAVAAAVKAAGGIAIASDLKAGTGIDIALDVTSEGGWRQAVAEIEQKHERLDGLVNAAGIVALGSVEQLDFADWRRVLGVNLDGTFLGCKYSLPLLRRRGGSIVNLSSVSGLIGGHNLAAYNASKGGVSLLTKSVALHGARLRPPVRCNALCPAFLEGPMVDFTVQSARNPETARQKMAQAIPLGRLGTPAEVANFCAYLLSDEAGFITGTNLPIDGGLTAG